MKKETKYTDSVKNVFFYLAIANMVFAIFVYFANPYIIESQVHKVITIISEEKIIISLYFKLLVFLKYLFYFLKERNLKERLRSI
jgi:hypothetical protein